MVFVVAVDGTHREIVYASLFQELLPDQIQITELLDPVVVKTELYLVTYSLEISPTAFNRQGVIKGEFLVHHAHGVICPHMVPSKLGQL